MNRDFFSAEKVNVNITAIRSACGEIMYLIEGDNKAVLMDTNLGVKGLRKLVDTITDKEYEVVITHGHLDHALGVPEFSDKNVYMNHKDIPLYQSMLPFAERDGYIHANLGHAFDEYGITNNDYVEEVPEFDFKELHDGMVFDLGGVTVEIYAYPGHTKGTMVLLIPELGILITGDACNKSTFLFDRICSSVTEYRQTTVNLRDRLSGRYDKVYICHHDMEVGKDILNEMIDVCDDILGGNTIDRPMPFMGVMGYLAKEADDHFNRIDGKSANLIYNKDKIL
ncbi:MBL fold metallo-hydrolase [Butyrivibrio sp. LC3010]|uniref:MBL fold metallo-hydrolase n=1 Tax=Butyrivibrio sp. LC3010 TaxID=1280680 RepID=UPI00041FCF42|nr:MBL fold metallo-hydrolase [Butyrivibrio sp. LC3010]